MENEEEFMTLEEIQAVIDKYVEEMNDEYSDVREERDKALTVTISGKEYGGHTSKALAATLRNFADIHRRDSFEEIEAVTLKILERFDPETKRKYEEDVIDSKKASRFLIYELFKAEWKIVNDDYEAQKDKFEELESVKATKRKKKVLTPEEIEAARSKDVLNVKEVEALYGFSSEAQAKYRSRASQYRLKPMGVSMQGKPVLYKKKDVESFIKLENKRLTDKNIGIEE